MAALAPTPSSLRLSPINKAHNFSIHLPSRSMASLRIASTIGISKTFERLKEKGKVAFIPHITAGDPDMSTTLKALKILDSCGSDIIELGVPYSDPLADGPVIQAAATRALSKGANFNAIVAMLKETIPQISSPIALFSYYNPILKRGVEKFMSIIEDVGVHGLVVPDVPLEETEILRKVAAKHHIELVLLATPTAPTERMKAIVEASEGFVYLIHTPVMCYSNFNDIIDMDAGVITIENSCSGKKILCEEVKYSAGIGQGVYDIHSPWIPSTEEIAGRINKILAVLEINILWVNPDCGLETRKFGEVNPALTNMVPAA